MTTTTTTTGQTGSNPLKNGGNGANTDTKAKATMEAKKEKNRIKNKLRNQKNKEKKNDNNNNNYVKFDGLIAEGIMKSGTISPGSSATMTSDFRNMKKVSSSVRSLKRIRTLAGCYRNHGTSWRQNVENETSR